jgi:hypothetical protein
MLENKTNGKKVISKSFSIHVKKKVYLLCYYFL